MLRAGIVGLPNVGKSTLFNAVVANAKAEAANFPFCTIEPNVGMVSVPDDRLNVLAKIATSVQIVPARVDFVDIAGLVKGASRGEGLGNQFLGNIRECNAILHVVRCFDNPNVVHVDGTVNPLRDKETIDFELQLKDLDTLEKRVDKAKKAAKSGGREALREVDMAERIKKHLEQGKNVRGFDRTEEEQVWIDEYQLLTEKPVLYVCNVDEAAAASGNDYVQQVRAMAATEKAGVMFLAAAVEADIAELESYDERNLFLTDLGLEEPGVNKVIRAAYSLLDLQTYFTAGVKEVRAWTVPVGATAPQAAGVIHTDFEKGFIRAEVISYSDYVQYKSEAAAKEVGRMRVEGKEYVVQDGDVMHFRFNV